MAQKVAGLYVKIDSDSAELISDLKKSTAELKKFGRTANRQANRVKYAFNKIRRAAQVVASVFIVKAAIQSFARLVFSIESAQEKVVLLQARMQQFARSGDAFARIYKLSQELGVSLDTTAEGMTRLLIATKSIGTTTEEIENVQKNIVLLGRAGGTSAEEMRSALIQLSQGMASGRLQGEELRSVLENLPLVAMEIARELGIDIGRIREFAAAGKIGSQVIVDSLQNVEVKVEELPETFSMSLARMKTEWALFAAQLGERTNTEAFFEGIAETLAAYRQGFFDDFSTVPTANLKKAYATTADLDLMKAISAELQKRRGLQDQINEKESIRLDLMLEEFDVLKLPKMKDSQLHEFVGGFKTIEDRIISAREWLALFKNDIINIYGEDKFNQIAEDIEKIGGELKEIDLNSLPRLRKTAGQSFEEISEYAKQAARNMQDAFADWLFDPFEDGLRGMVEGFIDAMRKIASNQIAASLFDTNTGFFGKLFGRATGGPVAAGTPYVVGERGPEMFVPGMSGMIIPNNKLNSGGAVQIFNSFEAGADVATIRAEIIPAMEHAQRAAVSEVMHRRREGRL